MITSLSFILPELLLTAVAVVLLLVDDGRREQKGLSMSLDGGGAFGGRGVGLGVSGRVRVQHAVLGRHRTIFESSFGRRGLDGLGFQFEL
jgi:hypothetical protein